MVASAVAFTNDLFPLAALIYQPNVNAVSSTTCKDVEFIFASGSGRELGGKDNNSWESALKAELASLNVSYNFYELGTSEYDGASYPSIGIGISSVERIVGTLTAPLSSLNIGAFIESVNEGAVEMAGRVRAVSQICPETKFVVGGYSQGAMVVDRAVPNIAPEKLIYAATFGDPNLYLPEGKGTYPPACFGKNLSNWRIYAPDCTAHAGFLGANKNYEPAGYAGKIGLWCTKYDIFCSNHLKWANLAEDHASYSEWGLHADAAKVIAKKIAATYPESVKSITSEKIAVKKRDTAILIDTTYSMQSKIDKFKRTALNIAKNTLEKGGRVALFEFRDELDDSEGLFEPQLLVDFGSSLSEIQTALDNLKTEGGGDIPESALSASLHAMNTLKWQKGATKSIVILTDAPYHSTDVRGITLNDVVKRSLEIDPVNFYIVYDDLVDTGYFNLAEQTNGAFFNVNSTSSLDFLSNTLLTRPEVNFPYEEYTVKPGKDITFEVSVDQKIVKYEWDLDFDGIFETETSAPSVTVSYDAETEGYLQVRVTGENGLTSTASASVTVTNKEESTPELADLEYNLSGNDLTINFSKSTDTAATFITAEGNILGYTEENSVKIKDVDFTEVNFQLTPVSTTGKKGESLQFAVRNPNSTTPVHRVRTSSADGFGGGSTTSNSVITPVNTPTPILAPNAGKQ